MSTLTDESLRASNFFRALHRPMLIMGGERNPMLFLALVCVSFPIAFVSLKITGLFMGLWTAGSFVLRRMAKADPLMSSVYSSQRHLQDYYGPSSTPFRIAKSGRTY